jgi:polyhydroxybutyrate depolymerase
MKLCKRINLLSLALLCCAFSGCFEGMEASQLQLKSININGVARSYYLYSPPKGKPSEKLPLVFVLHGGGNRGDGQTPAKFLGFTSLAERDQFLLIYPNGIDGVWNDGRGVTYGGPVDAQVDDVEFISKLIDHLVQDNNADPGRVYVTGISNGGMMTLRLGCELSSKLVAIAPITANIPKNIIHTCKPENSLMLLLMNGTDDPLVPYEGGFVRFLRKKMGEVVSTAETVSFWVKNNECDTDASVEYLPDTDLTDHSKVKVSTYTNSQMSCQVILYTIEGGGHTLPGSNIPNRPRLMGNKNNDIDGAQVIWEFFKSHSHQK